jgi:ribosomal protein S16
MLRVCFRRRRHTSVCDIVVVEVCKSGMFIDRLGFVNLKSSVLGKFGFIDLERLGFWLYWGAKVNRRVWFLLGMLSKCE